MIHILRAPATPTQIEEMQQALSTYVKLAVDLDRGVLAGGGVMHADCEALLLEDGSAQQDIWGADWNPTTRQVTFEALFNIRPGQDNPALEVLDPLRRERIVQIVRHLLEPK
jgi:RES domain-containing protein